MWQEGERGRGGGGGVERRRRAASEGKTRTPGIGGRKSRPWKMVDEARVRGKKIISVADPQWRWPDPRIACVSLAIGQQTATNPYLYHLHRRGSASSRNAAAENLLAPCSPEKF